MNERIRLLAAQAGIEFVYDPTETPLRAFVECWEDDMQKFAELIVQECFKAAMIESKGHMNPIDLMKRMKEQVGVEE